MQKEAIAVIIMGVSGSGKTSVGRELSELTGWPFFDADNYHPPENTAKMAAGEPLNDQDRIPWLKTLQGILAEQKQNQEPVILACSALKKKYRGVLRKGNDEAVFVHLQGSFELIFQRMKSRQDHYMKPEMLKSQFKDLEEPQDALLVRIDKPITEIVEEIYRQIAPRDRRADAQ